MHSRLSHLLFAAMYAVNVPLWLQHFPALLKITYAILVGIVTLLTALNQWDIYKKRHPASFIVFVADRVLVIMPKLKRKKDVE